MNGFPPSLDLKGLPRKCIIPPVNHQKTQYSRGPQAIYNVTSVTRELSALQRTYAPITGM
jgi:hypothetical protein